MGFGVLSKNKIEELEKEDSLIGRKAEFEDASSLDLTLSSTYYSFPNNSCFSIRHKEGRISQILEKCGLQKEKIPDDGLTLEPEKVYIFSLNESLDLSDEISAKASGRSTIGRLDVMTRLLSNDAPQYDIVKAGYTGHLYIEVIPQLFPIIVHEGDSLNQIRFYRGPQIAPIVTRDNIKYFSESFWYEDRGGGAFRGSKEIVEDPNEYKKLIDPSLDPRYFDLKVDLSPKYVIYLAKKIDEIKEKGLKIDLKNTPYYSIPWEYYWDKIEVQTEGTLNYVDLKPNRFYIISSKERLSLPLDICVDSLAISENLGDIRIHYAGFAHPYFGRLRNDGKPGTPLIFEVRSNDVSTTRLFDGAVLAKILFLCMADQLTEKDIKSGDYNNQEITLSKYFTEVPRYAKDLK